MQSISQFYWKVKSLRFTELSHETEVLNIVTEIMGLSSQIRSQQSLMLGKQSTLHSKMIWRWRIVDKYDFIDDADTFSLARCDT